MYLSTPDVMRVPAVVLALALMLVGCNKPPEEGEAKAVTNHHENSGPTNRLGAEKSPYLLQHAHNPVDWYPWGEEAFDLARQLDRPIFLSIGYSTCHWCHVMAHESFEDAEVAALMNEAFVCIKVDREERPDVDGIYMRVCQMMTGRGGWPLTIIMTPDKKPFFAATYIPKAGIMNLVPQVTAVWSDDRASVLDQTNRVLQALEQSVAGSAGEAIRADALDRTYEQLASSFDSTYGGFGTRPKFPTPHNILFLLRYWDRTGNEKALHMVETTLTHMRQGGIFDHVGFGFHRYSTDERWFVPHFEKMLYDQAMLMMAYTESYQATGKATYRETAEEIATYLLRDMREARGGFYSAEDADSEGEEGKFYLWSSAELASVLGDDAEIVESVFGAEPDGNYADEASGERSGTNLFYLPTSLSERAVALGIDENVLRERVESARRRLFEVRERRVHPGKDDKVLADWNGLAIAAFAKAARAFDEPAFAEAAAAAARFVISTLGTKDHGLLHRYRDGDASITGMIDDYAFFVWGLLELYETTFELSYLEDALGYTDRMLDRFWDKDGLGLFVTSEGGEELLIRQKEVYDGAVPSGNSVAMLNLIRLGKLTARDVYSDRAREIGLAFSNQVSTAPAAFTALMCAVDFAVGPSFELVIAGTADGDDTREMARAIASTYTPRKVVLLRPEGSVGRRVAEIAPYAKEQRAIDNRATAYVCRNYACELPTNSAQEMLRLLGKK